MNKINSIEEFSKSLKSKKTILYFTASWCPDCLFIKPHIPALELENSDFTIYEVDRDQFIDECIALDILGIPSFLIFHEGKEILRFVSKMKKSKDEVSDFIKKGRELINV